MAYEPYATVDDYNVSQHNAIPSDELQKRLKEASRHIDSLTFNRIIGRGYDNLSIFQQDIITECVCDLADFEFENEDMIQSVLQNYSINGVSMQFGSNWNVLVQNGVAIKKDIYAKLMQTGLCNPTLRR